MSHEQMYPCANCGTLRTKAEGGTVFTVCDACWDKHWKKTPEQALKRIEEDHSNCCGWPQKGDDCDVVKLARALADMMSCSGLAEPATRRASWERAERVLSEVAGGGDEG